MANDTEPPTLLPDPPKSDLRRFAEVMAAHGVEFIVIGGQAGALM